jgi:riboflavin kinase / FMN adenylyltransferase
MKVVSSLSDAALKAPSVLSIGNFDGIHLGHRAILDRVVQRALELGVRPTAMTFDPHPIRVLTPEKSPKLIGTLDQRLRLIEQAGIELTFVAKFDQAFAALTADEFIEQYIVGGLHARAICVGSNFNFGAGGRGNVETLRRHSSELEIIEVPPVTVRGVVVSSTHIRKLVQLGRVSQACRLLGRWFEIEGRIVTGAGRGRNVTVPTLNLESQNELLPEKGVYVTRISLGSGEYLDSVTNIGVRPTFGEEQLTIETFVLHDPIPSATSPARLQFLRRIRDERRFESPDALRSQIRRDVGFATRFFHLLRTPGHARIHSR